MAPDPLLVSESSGSTTCPKAQSMPPARRRLRCRHVPRGTERATRQERALVLPCALRHQARHTTGKGSGVATGPEAPSPSPDRRGLRSHHVPCGSKPTPCTGRLWHCHMTDTPGPPPGRAPVSPCVLCLQTCLLVREGSGAITCPVAVSPRACPCVPKMPDNGLIMASPRTRCRQRIKCVCDRPYTVYDRH
jgi:hypothetical protein